MALLLRRGLNLPFWPISGRVWAADEVSREPPTEWIELAVEVRRWWVKPGGLVPRGTRQPRGFGAGKGRLTNEPV